MSWPPEDETSQAQAGGRAIARAEVIGPILSRRFRAYGADARRSVLQLVTTGTAFIALIVVMAVVGHSHYWLTLLLAIPAAGLLVRLFIIQHDCGHGSFFKSRGANDLVGRAISVLTLTPYWSWSQGHAAHHASTGNLDRRGRGDVETWTVAEYQGSAPLKKLLYRLYRNPFVMVGLGAPINFIVLQRLPLGRALRASETGHSSGGCPCRGSAEAPCQSGSAALAGSKAHRISTFSRHPPWRRLTEV